MIATTYTTTPTVVYEADEVHEGQWYGFLRWTGPNGEAHSVPLSEIEHLDRIGPTEGEG